MGAFSVKVFRLPHPPVRGKFWLQTRPMVHGGFLRSWTANELNERVMARLRDILAASVVPPADFKVFLTGQYGSLTYSAPYHLPSHRVVAAASA